MNLESKPNKGLLVSRDLFFTSKVTGTAAALGLSVHAVPDIAQALARISASKTAYSCVIVDLGDPSLDVTGLMTQLPGGTRPKVIAFGSHVATARLAEAAAAGCDEVLPRSRFTATLPELLKQYVCGSDGAGPPQ